MFVRCIDVMWWLEPRRRIALLLQCLPMTQKRNVTIDVRANSFESDLLIESAEPLKINKNKNTVK